MEAVVHQTRPAARGVLIAMCVCAGILLIPALGHRDSWVILLTVCVLPVAAIAMLVFAVMLFRGGTGRSSATLLVGGLFFVTGGVACDIIATVVFTPDLSHEANVVARLLLDSDFSVSSVYVIGGFFQLLLLSITCILWAAFLRHREVIVNSSFRLAPNSFASFFKAATGGGSLTWRQWIAPLTYRDLPSAYHVALAIAPLMVGGAAYRWYLGFQWFGLMPYFNNSMFVLSTVLVAVLLYATWLHREFRACIRRSKEITENEMAPVSSE